MQLMKRHCFNPKTAGQTFECGQQIRLFWTVNHLKIGATFQRDKEAYNLKL
jgi:hypothetical protein